VLRAINGNRTTNIGTAATRGARAGIWAFTPPGVLPQVKRLRDNTTTISFQGTPVTVADAHSTARIGMDGSITTYNNTSLFVGMRRGWPGASTR
jgi:hypothetical protein